MPSLGCHQDYCWDLKSLDFVENSTRFFDKNPIVATAPLPTSSTLLTEPTTPGQHTWQIYCAPDRARFMSPREVFRPPSHSPVPTRLPLFIFLRIYIPAASDVI